MKYIPRNQSLLSMTKLNVSTFD